MAICLGFMSACPTELLARPFRAPASPTPAPQAAVLDLTLIPAARAANTIRTLFPRARVRVDTRTNAVVVLAAPDDLQQIRAVVQGLDVRNPTRPTVDVITLHVLKPQAVAQRIARLYPGAHVDIASKQSLVIRATPADQTEIQSLIASLDVAPPSAAPSATPEDTVRIVYARPKGG